MTKHLVTGIRSYNFVDDNGNHLQGVKVYYLDNHLETEGNAKGYFPLNLSLPGDHGGKFSQVPGLYDLDFKMAPDKYGKPQIKLHDVTFIESIDLPVF